MDLLLFRIESNIGIDRYFAWLLFQFIPFFSTSQNLFLHSLKENFLLFLGSSHDLHPATLIEQVVGNHTPVTANLFSFAQNCERCSKFFSDRDSLNRHRLNEHGSLALCDLCNSTFTSWSGYRLHMNVHMTASSSGHNECTCQVCGKVLQSRHHLDIHLRSHSNVKPYMCLICGRSYKHNKDLRKHKCPA